MENTANKVISGNEVEDVYLRKLNKMVEHPYIPVKHLLDVIFAGIILVVTSPVILLFMLLVRLETPGNVFYGQERVGLMGKKFKVVKLRSMYDGIEKKSGAMWAQKNDPRVTKIGHFMRKTRIDELPQLWSVIKGDMSLIGPRPERPNFTAQFSEEYPGFEQRLRIKPGLSGYAQVHGGYDVTPGEKAELDNYYIEHFGISIDAHIFFKTIAVVFTGDGAR